METAGPDTATDDAECSGVGLGSASQPPDGDPSETQEWVESLDGLVGHAGRTRARAVLRSVLQRVGERQVGMSGLAGTDYVNTIPPGAEPEFPGDEWAFLGDGEMDEPESLGVLGVAAREELDNLTFVVNCNLQRLDGPVRGNGKIIQELESFFRGAGWNVVKVIWGRQWDPLLAADTDGALVNLMNVTPDGDYQTYKAESGAFVREHFFGRDPRTQRMAEHLTDDQIRGLKRGGHDYRKLYAAYRAATGHTGQPTVILAKTIKGWTLGSHFEGRNSTHQMKKLTLEDLKNFRDRLHVPIADGALDETRPPYYRPPAGSDELDYLHERRHTLGGYLPDRRVRSAPLALPGPSAYASTRRGSGNQQVATTMAFVRLLKDLMKDPEIGHRFVPIIPDEARTFGMDALFRSKKIYSPHGQHYLSVDRDLLLAYQEDTRGVLLHEGITEAGSVASWTAAGTSYAPTANR